jgi:hypothetical protein
VRKQISLPLFTFSEPSSVGHPSEVPRVINILRLTPSHIDGSCGDSWLASANIFVLL